MSIQRPVAPVLFVSVFLCVVGCSDLRGSWVSDGASLSGALSATLTTSDPRLATRTEVFALRSGHVVDYGDTDLVLEMMSADDARPGDCSLDIAPVDEERAEVVRGSCSFSIATTDGGTERFILSSSSGTVTRTGSTSSMELAGELTYTLNPVSGDSTLLYGAFTATGSLGE